MAKDRLADLLKVRKKDDVEVELKEVPSTSTNIRKTFQRSEVIQQWIDQIEKNLNEIKIHIKRYDDMKYNQKELQDKIQSLFQNNTSIAKQISQKLKEIELEIGEKKPESAEYRIIQIQQQGASLRFKEIFMENNHQLENYKNLQKRHIRAQLTAKGDFQVTDEELTALLDEGKDIQLFTENIIHETTEARRILQDVEERHLQLLKIERMLQEVHDMFVQLSILVDNQQELVDRIEFQAEAARNYIGSGTNQLEKARNSQTKSRKLKICVYIILAIFIVLLIVGLVIQFR